MYTDSAITIKRVIEEAEEKSSKILYRHLHGGLKAELTISFFSNDAKGALSSVLPLSN